MVQWLNARVTIALPEDEYEKIKRHPEVKWAAIARKAMVEYADHLEKFKNSLEKEKTDSEKTKE